ncbi:pentatricopeptide repeat-containing protein At2g34400-like [Arachis ipaensis]|uniref:pentatricopeptide repeat-containing protein At2g34400-like n=1 Tax=Arachis ipaensis TaxID=130454 RepID=UPI0007AF6322|nr:pentatricopeptide repeat-containing protein At2g34400-like [Arachis ipaensis]
MYAKCSDLVSARRIFDLIIKKSISSWTSMIAGYAHSDHPLEALHLFRRLVRTDFRPDGPTVATVISACADIGSISIAQEMEDYISLNGLEFDLLASELSRADNLKSDLENNKNQFNDMVASEKELQQKLARLEEMKKELEKQIRTTNANIMASRKELNTTLKRKRGVYVEGKALKAQMDVKEKVPRLQHEHDLAKENQEKIKAEWSEFGEKINEIVVKSAVQD